MKNATLNIVIIVGIILSFGGLGIGFALEGGDVASLFGLSAMLIIFGGTIGSTMIMMRKEEIFNIPKTLKKVFVNEDYDFADLILKLSDWSSVARKEGAIELEELSEKEEDPFIKKGIGYILEGNEHDAIKELLEIEIDAMAMRHELGAKPYEQAGGIAPTMGIIGAVMGLVVVLAGLGSSGVDELGQGIAVAFLATLMGIGFANLICIPFAENLKNKSEQEVLYRTVIKEGILGIHTGSSPALLQKRLMAYLPTNFEEILESKKEENKQEGSGS